MWKPNQKVLQHRQRMKKLLECGKGYFFDEEAAQKPVQFIESNLCFYNGVMQGKPFVLTEFQREVIRDLYGMKKRDGTRLFNEAFVMVPRSHGKTALISCLALYSLFYEAAASEIILAANSRAQASNGLLKDCRILALQSPKIAKKLSRGIENHKVFHPKRLSEIRAISKESGSNQGLKYVLCVLDEYHEAKTNEFHNTLLTTLGKIPQALFIKITTAGSDLNSPCYAQYEHASAVLAGSIEADSFFAYIIEADRSLPWDSDEALYQANPNVGISVELDTILSERQKALSSPSFKGDYQRYRLNQFVGASESKWLNMEDWHRCKRDFNEEELIGQPCYMGIDLSTNTDLSALSIVFPQPDGSVKCLAWGFLPAKDISYRQQVDKCEYMSWAQQGHLILHPDNIVDHNRVAEFVLEKARLFDVRAIVYDNWNSQALVNTLKQQGFKGDLITFVQHVSHYHTPCQAFERHILTQQFLHNGNPLLNWCAGNIEVLIDPQGKIRPIKNASNPTQRIDLLIATLFAFDAFLRNENKPEESKGSMMEMFKAFPKGLFG